jgi:hypothetical protein
MELLFAKAVCHHFGPGLMAWQHPKKKKKAWANTASQELGYLLFCFMLISWVTIQLFFFGFFAMSQFDWPIAEKS